MCARVCTCVCACTCLYKRRYPANYWHYITTTGDWVHNKVTTTVHTRPPPLPYTHTHAHTTTTTKHIFLLPLCGHAHLTELECPYTLSRHCEPRKQSSWSLARNSQENRPFLTASGVGTQSPTWTIAVSWGKARYPITAGWSGGAGGRQMEN